VIGCVQRQGGRERGAHEDVVLLDAGQVGVDGDVLVRLAHVHAEARVRQRRQVRLRAAARGGQPGSNADANGIESVTQHRPFSIVHDGVSVGSIACTQACQCYCHSETGLTLTAALHSDAKLNLKGGQLQPLSMCVSARTRAYSCHKTGTYTQAVMAERRSNRH